MFLSVSYELSRFNVLSNLQSKADLWVVFLSLLGVLARQNRAANPKVSAVCTEPGGQRGIGTFFLVVIVTTFQVDSSVPGPHHFFGDLKDYCYEW